MGEVDPIVSSLRAQRRRLGLTQTEVGQRIGRQTYQTIGQWERGLNPPNLRNLRAWATALGCDLTLTTVVERAQREYDATHNPNDHHCLTNPCVWHPYEQRLHPLPTYPATLLVGGDTDGTR